MYITNGEMIDKQLRKTNYKDDTEFAWSSKNFLPRIIF